MTTPVSAYEAIGGARTVRRMVELLYHWISMDDELWIPYFAGHDLPTLKSHMVKLLSQLLGGPATYAGRSLVEAHAGLRITPAAFKRVANYVHAALLVVQADDEIVSTVMGIAAAQAPDIVTAA